jgi:hypothetical protein
VIKTLSPSTTFRLVRLESGWLRFELTGNLPRAGPLVLVTAYDGDGLVRETKGWSQRYGHHYPTETFEAFLGDIADLDRETAGRIATEVFREWGEKGTIQEAKRWTSISYATMAGVLLAVGLALFGVFAAVWLLAS